MILFFSCQSLSLAFGARLWFASSGRKKSKKKRGREGGREGEGKYTKRDRGIDIHRKKETSTHKHARIKEETMAGKKER